jgi:SAM-dependent methyltransferase
MGLILDVGCGPAVFATELNHSKIFYIGIDLSEKVLKIAKKIVKPGGFILGDMHYLPFRDSVFDYILVANSFSEFDIDVNKKIYHSIPHQMLIDEILRVLKNNGTLFLTTPNRYHRIYKRKRKADFWILKKSLKKFKFQILGFNPTPILMSTFLDIKPLNIIYLALIELVMKFPYSKYVSMFFYVEAIKKDQN